MPSNNNLPFDVPTQDDDLYLASADDASTAYYPQEDDNQKSEEAKNNGVIAASYPILPELAKWFEEQIAACDNIGNIQIDSMEFNGHKFSRKASIEGQVLANQLLKEMLVTRSRDFLKLAKQLEEDVA